MLPKLDTLAQAKMLLNHAMLSGMKHQGQHMNQIARHEYLRVLRKQYSKASRKCKSELLTEAESVTGLHRKALIRLLHSNPPAKPGLHYPKKSHPTYSHETRLAIKVLWQAANYIAAERLHPFIPDLLDKLLSCGELKVTDETLAQLHKVSLATVKRIIAHDRQRSVVRLGGTTKPGSLLKSQIAIRYGRWDEVSPGWCETDTVAHCGETLVGTFIYSVNLVDICSGWSEQIAIMGKGERVTISGLVAMRERLPFVLLGLDSDNGSEFINWHLAKFAHFNHITFTRSRPYQKNDNAHVEQKNWTAIRQLVGYVRLDTDIQQAILNDLYANEWRLYLNFFQPTMKLKTAIKDQRTGKRTKRYYGAQTPYQRLMAHPDVNDQQKAMLQSIYDSLNPLKLQSEIKRKLKLLNATVQ